MKRLVISMKTSDAMLKDFKAAYRQARARRSRASHYEIAFDNRKDFELFIRNIHILSKVLAFKPKSVYELAKLCKIDTSNLNKIILFLERIGALRLKEQTISGRSVRTPIVDYDLIQFDLAA